MSGACSAADWFYVTTGANEDFYIDRSYYKYNSQDKTVDVWTRTDKESSANKGERRTTSKTLTRYSCSNKSSRQLADASYLEDGSVLRQTSTPQSKFDMIFPDTVGENIWEVSCKTQGKGFKFPDYRPKLLTKDEIESLGIVR